MKNYNSNEEFFRDLRSLIERWCDERKFDALARILPGYLALNGLTDGWAHLYEALKAVRAIGAEGFSEADWDMIDDLIHAAEAAVHRRQYARNATNTSFSLDALNRFVIRCPNANPAQRDAFF